MKNLLSFHLYQLWLYRWENLWLPFLQVRKVFESWAVQVQKWMINISGTDLKFPQFSNHLRRGKWQYLYQWDIYFHSLLNRRCISKGFSVNFNFPQYFLVFSPFNLTLLNFFLYDGLSSFSLILIIPMISPREIWIVTKNFRVYGGIKSDEICFFRSPVVLEFH